MITAEDIERAEKMLNLSGQAGGMGAVYARADAEPEAVAQLIKHRREGVRNSIPDMDPRHEPTWNTMMAHMFLVGVLCGKGEADGRQL